MPCKQTKNYMSVGRFFCSSKIPLYFPMLLVFHFLLQHAVKIYFVLWCYSTHSPQLCVSSISHIQLQLIFAQEGVSELSTVDAASFENSSHTCHVRLSTQLPLSLFQILFKQYLLMRPYYPTTTLFNIALYIHSFSNIHPLLFKAFFPETQSLTYYILHLLIFYLICLHICSTKHDFCIFCLLLCHQPL